MPTLERDGWTLVSAEDRPREHPDTFLLPERSARENLAPGDGVQLLFDIETRQEGRVIDRGVDRMWVIVRSSSGGRFTGVLDSDPGSAGDLNLRPGQEIRFGPEPVGRIETPPREYVLEKYGASFFDGGDQGVGP